MLLLGNLKVEQLCCALLCVVKTSAWTPKGSVAACLKAIPALFTSTSIPPCLRQDLLFKVVQFWYNVCFYKLCFMFCWTSHKRWKKSLLTSPWWCPSRPQQWQGLQGHRGGILERAPLLQGSPLLPVESKVQNLKNQIKITFENIIFFSTLPRASSLAVR